MQLFKKTDFAFKRELNNKNVLFASHNVDGYLIIVNQFNDDGLIIYSMSIRHGRTLVYTRQHSDLSFLIKEGNEYSIDFNTHYKQA